MTGARFSLAAPTPELPVRDVRAAQEYYRDRLGFEIAWYDEGGGIGAVSRGACAVFLRATDADIRPAAFWIFADDIDAAHGDFVSRGADVVQEPRDMPWGLRQFTVRDLNGNLFHVHRDLRVRAARSTDGSTPLKVENPRDGPKRIC